MSTLNGFSTYISANTLRNHENIHWSFGKGDRFSNQPKAVSQVFYNLPSSLKNRKVSFGMGNRSKLSSIVGKDSPPPTSYRIKSQFEKQQKISHRCFFGIPHKYPGGGGLANVSARLVPGPGTYDLGTTVCKNTRTFSFRGRGETLGATKSRSDAPAPNVYTPNYTWHNQKRYTQIGFGYGERSFDSRNSLRSK